jgi:Uma2 family endonuclease
MALLYPAARAADLRLLAEVNLGEPGDFRVPDACVQDPGAPRLYYPTAALAVEVVSPSDETWAKLEFYAAHGVQELLIVDPQARRVQLLALAGGVYAPSERSGLIELERSSFAELIDWPSLEDGAET